MISRFNNLSLTQKLLCFYVIAIPIMKVPYLPFFEQKVQYSEIVFLFLVTSWLIKLYRDKRRVSGNFLILPACLIIICLLLSLFNSVSILRSLVELSGIVYLVFMFLLVPQVLTTKEEVDLVLEIWVLTASVVSLLGIIGILIWIFFKESFIFLMPQPSLSSILVFPRMHSTFRMGSMLASYLHISIVFAFIKYFMENNRKKKILLGLAIFLMLLTTFFTASRPLFGSVLSLFILLLMTKGTMLLKMLRCCVFILVILLFVWMVVITIWVVVPISFSANKDEMSLSIKIHYPFSLYMHLYGASIKMIKSHPFFGVGIGMFNEKVIDYVDWEKPDIILSHKYRQLDTWRGKSDPHSTYLGWAAETGIIGISSFLLFLSVFINKLLKVIRVSPQAEISSSAKCILAGLAGFMINAFYIDILTMRHFWFMLSLGVIIYNMWNKYKEGNNYLHG